MNYEKELDRIIETNEELRKVFEKHPERRKLYIEKMKDSEGETWSTQGINPAYCKKCVFQHGKPPFADMPEKAYCEIYPRGQSTGKPPDVYYHGAECEYYIHEKD